MHGDRAVASHPFESMPPRSRKRAFRIVTRLFQMTHGPALLTISCRTDRLK